jgi:dienelactone hydrolase
VKEELHVYGNDFLRRGMAVLAIDGPGQGEMEFEFALRHDYEVPIKYAIDYLEGRADVDAQHVGLMGVSFGGQFVVRAAAFEPRIKATVENCGPYDQAENFRGRPQISRETLIHRLKGATEEEALNKLTRFNLQGVAEKVRSPLLVIQGEKDRLVPPSQGKRIAEEVAGAELWLFEDGNHVCNNIPYKHRPQQADWMRKKLAR